MERPEPMLLTDMIMSGPENPIEDEGEVGGDTDYVCPGCGNVVLANFDPILIEAVGAVIAVCAKCGTNWHRHARGAVAARVSRWTSLSGFDALKRFFGK
jgi:hypothetical protein